MGWRSKLLARFFVLGALAACGEEAANHEAVALTEELLRQAPAVSSITPESGPTSGGNVVEIAGANFRSDATVSFGEIAATKVEYVSPTLIRATVPAHAAGEVDVTVRNSARRYTTVGSAYAYEDGQATMTRALALGAPDLVARAGDTITLAMRFDALPMESDYQVFVHFVNEAGVQQKFQADHAPKAPTSKWQGPIAYDQKLTLPADVPAGKYSVRIGLYELVPPYDHRIALATGPGVIVDNELRYTVGTLTIGGETTPPPSGNPPPSSSTGPAGQNANDYTLAFNEEFDTFDANLWNDHIWYESPNPTKNFTVENGALKIWPERDGSGNFFNRTVDTDGHYTQTYGYFEMEAKLPKGRGTWPAFWIFNHIGDRRPEIDIMEAYPGGDGWGIDGPGGVRLPTAYGATIWTDANQRGGFEMIQTPDLSAAFHKYGLKWEPNKQTFYFDGQAVYSADVSMGDPMYIMLDLWFGSASGQPDSTTPTGIGNSYEVNYVRAWQFK